MSTKNKKGEQPKDNYITIGEEYSLKDYRYCLAETINNKERYPLNSSYISKEAKSSNYRIATQCFIIKPIPETFLRQHYIIILIIIIYWILNYYLFFENVKTWVQKKGIVD